MLTELDETPEDGRAFAGEKGEIPPKNSLWRWVRFVATLVMLGLVLRSCFIAPFNIPSRSMTPEMLVGDFLFAAKWSYGYSRYSFPFSLETIEGRVWGSQPDRGDIVVFRSPADTNSDYVKRVIGLPGDRIRLLNGDIIINGETVPRERIEDYREPIATWRDCPIAGDTSLERDGESNLYCRTPRYRETLPNGVSYDVLDAGPTTADTTPEYVVPEDHFFLLGDDRDRSADSRFEPRPGGGIGFVPEENIVGRALVIFWSTDGTASWPNPVSWFRAARWDRIGKSFGDD